MRAAAWLLLLALAGCVGNDGAGTGPPSTDDEAAAGPVVAIAECVTRACWEANVAADSAGRLFVTAYDGAVIARSLDGGATFAPIAPPAMPASAPAGARHNDALLQVDFAGRLFFSSFIPGDRDPGSVFVARSDDGGATWATAVHLPPAGAAPGSSSVLADRQWLGFAQDGAVYVSYTLVPAGSFVARSDDGGATFGPFLPASPAIERANFGQAGPIVVTPGGRAIFPHLARASPLALAAGGAASVRVSVSDDGGVTWRAIETHVVAPPEDAGYNLPIATPAPDGAIHVAWVDYGNVLHVLTSGDDGATWSAPERWSAEGERVPTAAWIAADARAMHVAYYVESDGAVSLVHARRAPGGEVERRVVVEGIPAGEGSVAGVPDPRAVARTDFAHIALLPDGRAALAWVDEAARVQVHVTQD